MNDVRIKEKFEDIYCPDGCQFQKEEVEEIDRKRWRKWIIKHHLS